MNIFYLSGFVRNILLLLLGIGLVIFGMFLYAHWNFEVFGLLVTSCGAILAAIFLTVFAIDTGSLIHQRNKEPIIYQQMIAKKQSLEQAFEHSHDVVNTDLYTHAVAWNTELAKIQTAANDPKYAITFSGKVDWLSIEPIEFD